MPISAMQHHTFGKEVSVTKEQMAHCAKEPIHRINTIQPYGTLIVCDYHQKKVVAHAENLGRHFDFLDVDLFGRSLTELLPNTINFEWVDAFNKAQQAHAITVGKIVSPDQQRHWEVSIHKTPNQHKDIEFVVEFIPCCKCQVVVGNTQQSDQFIQQITDTLEELQQMESLETFTNKSCQAIQEFTQFDRVFLYRFDEDWSGQIIAEATRSGIAQEYLGQHFPEGDIPEQARKIFLKNPIRISEDFNSEPCQIIDRRKQGYDLDQTYGLLRQPSDMHVIYMRNIGVRSSLTISLVYGGKLWGMLSCHHYSPKSILVGQRSALLLACKLLTIGITSHLEHLLESERLERETEESDCLFQIGKGHESQQQIIKTWKKEQPRLQKLFNANHVSLVIKGEWFCQPKIHEDYLKKLIKHAKTHSNSGRFFISELGNYFSCNDFSKANLYGCFVGKITNIRNSYLVIFRPEVKLIKKWGGNPNSATEITTPEGKTLLGPRTSFSTWEKEVSNRSEPFNETDFAFASKTTQLLSQLLLSQKARRNEKSLALLGFSIEHLKDSFMVTDHDEVIQFVNQALIDLTGYSREELIGSTPKLLQGRDTDPKAMEDFRTAIENYQSIERTVINYKKNGEPYFNEITINPVFDEQGSFLNYISVQRDVTEKIKAKIEVENSQRDLDLTLKIIPDIILEFNDRDTLLRSNRTNKDIELVDGKLITGRSLEHLFPEKIAAIFRKAFKEAQKSDHISNIEYELSNHENTQYFNLSVSIKKNPQSGRLSYVCLLHDITELRENEKHISLLAHNDSLTGIYNRRAFLKRISEIYSESIRFNRYYAILYLDLDQFKQLNDTQGHSAGDLLLVELSYRLSKSIRSEDVIARMGGDEFVVLLTNFSSLDSTNKFAAEISNKIISACRLPFRLMHSNYLLTCSMGIAIGGGSIKKNPEELLKNADMAMYQSKKSGGDCWHFFDPHMQKLAFEHSEMEQELRQAIDNNDINIHYQPIISDNDQIIGFEALARWNHRIKGPVPPDIFIPLAEESQLIVQLGELVLKKACKQLVAWQQDSMTAQWSISVNVSARQVQQADFLYRLSKIIDRAGIRRELLILEITESLLQENISETVAMIETLSEQNIRFALDDFGTGYSSLSYLKRLPIHFLKIDKSFIQDVLEDKEDAAIVKMILSLAKTIGQTVIAEGVETKEQYQYLKNLGCSRFQGLYVCQPLASQAIIEWVQASPWSIKQLETI